MTLEQPSSHPRLPRSMPFQGQPFGTAQPSRNQAATAPDTTRLGFRVCGGPATHAGAPHRAPEEVITVRYHLLWPSPIRAACLTPRVNPAAVAARVIRR